MATKLEEFVRQSIDNLLKKLPAKKRLEGLSPKERLEGLSPAKRLEGVSLAKRLAGLSPEQRLDGLSREELRAVVEAIQRRLQSNAQSPKPS